MEVCLLLYSGLGSTLGGVYSVIFSMAVRVVAGSSMRAWTLHLIPPLIFLTLEIGCLLEFCSSSFSFISR